MSATLTADEARALGERLEALRLPGIEGGAYWHPPSGHRIRAERPFGWVGPVPVYAGYLLDLRIAGNRGELLEVVRERWGCPEAFLFSDLPRWEVTAWIPNARGRVEANVLGHGPTEAAALVAALEAAPRGDR